MASAVGTSRIRGAKIRAPMTGCSMMCRYSASVSFPALCRTASDTPILPMSCSSAPRATPSITACDSPIWRPIRAERSEEHTSELQSRLHLVCRLLLEKKKKKKQKKKHNDTRTTRNAQNLDERYARQ